MEWEEFNMPGIQILPPKTQTGFGPALSALIQGGIQGFEENQKKQQRTNAVQKYFNSPDDLSRYQAFLSLGKEDREGLLELEKFKQEYSRIGDLGNNIGDRGFEKIEDKSPLPKGELPKTQSPNLTIKKFNKRDITTYTDEDLVRALAGKKSKNKEQQGIAEQAVGEQKRREQQQTRNIAQEKLEDARIERSDKAHQPFIDEVTNRFNTWEGETKPKLEYLQKKSTDEQLIGPTANAFLETLGIPLGSLENPGSEVYQKISQDLLKGLPESYGSRILKVEVDNFLKTIPTLQNSPEGRRMIASNMLKLGEMKEVYYDEMRRQQQNFIDENKPYPRDFQQRVLDNVRPQMNRMNQEFVKMNNITHVPENTSPFFNPQGEIEFVPNELVQWAIDNGGTRIW